MAVPLTVTVFKGGQLIATKDFARDVIKIGSLGTAHLILDDLKVAPTHSVIEIAKDGSVAIVDMGSPNGTFVNGHRVTKSPIGPGDEIRVGMTTLRVQPTGTAQRASRNSTAPTILGVSSAYASSASRTTSSPSQAGYRPSSPSRISAQPGGAVPREMRSKVSQSGAGYAAPLVPRASRPPVQRASVPRQAQGAVQLGLELRFMWGDQNIGEFFMQPQQARAFTLGVDSKADFDIATGKLGSTNFELVRATKEGFQVRFQRGMHGELQRGGEAVITLADAISERVASDDGGAMALSLHQDDFVWIDLGGVVVELFFQPVQKPVAVPITEVLDFTILNIFLFVAFIAAIFVIAAVNRDAEGEAYGDDLNASQARIAKLLIKPPDNVKNPILEKYEKKKEAGEAAEKAKGDEGKMGQRNAPDRSAASAPKGDPNDKDHARMLVNKVFSGTGGISTIIGHAGLGGDVKGALGGLFGQQVGDSGGLGGLGLRGSGSGGGGTGSTIGVGNIGSRGRGGGNAGYGANAGSLGKKRATDVEINSSDLGVVGSLDKELIRQVIRAHRSEIRYCYESQLNQYPDLNGSVAVKFVITPSGSVNSSDIVKSTLGNATMEKCVAGRILGWKFPEPKGGGVVIVTYPFIFKSAGQ